MTTNNYPNSNPAKPRQDASAPLPANSAEQPDETGAGMPFGADFPRRPEDSGIPVLLTDDVDDYYVDFHDLRSRIFLPGYPRPKELPANADGTPFTYAWDDPFHGVVLSNTFTPIVCHLIPNYLSTVEESDYELAFVFRRVHLGHHAARKQQAELTLLEVNTYYETGAYPEFPQPELDAISALALGEVIELDEWTIDCPLYVMAVDYAPYTRRPVPRGKNVVLLDSSTELGFVQAMEQVTPGKLRYLK